MRKYFTAAASDGPWDGLWAGTAVEERLRHAREDFLTPVFDRYFPRDGKIVEAGCGLGHYVMLYRARGYDIEGVEDSAVAVAKARAYSPGLPLHEADVRTLPYPDRSVAVYFSGGVLEHFEEGPAAALAEAYRVLRDDGLLIVTVPYLNGLRRVRDLARGPGAGYTLVAEFAVELSPAGRTFYQYAFTEAEATRALRAGGFVPIVTRGVQIVWGLRKALGRSISPRSGGPRASVSSSAQPSALRRLVRREHAAHPVGDAVMRAAGRLTGHMLLLVCRKDAA